MARPKSQWYLDYQRKQRQINAYARACYCPRLRAVEKIFIFHPEEYRRNRAHSPCEDCAAEPCCDLPCPAYLQWYNAKLHALRVKLTPQ